MAAPNVLTTSMSSPPHRRPTTSYGPSESLPHVEVVSPAIHRDILADAALSGRGTTRGSTPLPGALRSNVPLNEAVAIFQQASLSKRTIGSYSSGVRAWKTFCSLSDVSVSSTSLPDVSEELLVYFVSHCATFLHLKLSTIKLYLAGIRSYYVMNGHRNPLVSEYGHPYPRLKNVLKGIHRVQGSSTRPRLPITADILRRMCNILNEGVFGPYIDLLLQSAFLLAFFGFLRCSEFTSTTHKFDPSVTSASGTYHHCIQRMSLLSVSTTEVIKN
ncbi:uncharacterized protein [Ptychodera flava]|uniref:uncharacterized protein n=1 Tax=Ptychodera flava TaxID=63121 RepID=UPI003969ECEB